MNHLKKHSIVCIMLCCMPVFVVGIITYFIDPFQIYRPQRMVKPMFFSDQRYQNAGKINSYLSQDGYDAVIIGHSQTDNFLPSQVADYMGWNRVMKLTMDGGNPSEESLVLERALIKGDIKHVLWGAGYAYANDRAEVWNQKRPFPFFFYTDTIFDDEQYLFSLDSFKKSINLLCRNLNNSWNSNLETLNYWMTERINGFLTFNSRKNLRKLTRKRALSLPVLSEKATAKTYLTAESNLIRIVRDNPKVQFVIYFPPYFRGVPPGTIIAYSQLQAYLVRQCTEYPNVEFYGFSDSDQITANAANFRDMRHYHSGINLYMLKRMARGKNKLDIDNIEGYTRRVRERALAYIVVSDIQSMIPMAKKEEREKFRKLLRNRRKKKKNRSD